jgi:hypothetical protein
MTLNWLFVVQNFEVKSYEDSAAKIEVIEPIKKSTFVKNQQVLCFDRSYTEHYADIVQSNLNKLLIEIGQEPVVIYGAGLHTQQHMHLFKQFNIVAITDRDENLWGEQLSEIDIIPPDKIPNCTEHVIISSKAYEESIHKDLIQRYSSVNSHKLYCSLNSEVTFYKNMHEKVTKSMENSIPDVVFYCPTHPSDCLPVSYWLQIKAKFPKVKFITLWWDYDEEANSPYLNFERDCLQWNDLCIENSNATRIDKMRKGLPPYENHQNSNKVVFHPTIFDPELFYLNTNIEKKYDIALFGSAAGQRKHWISLLKDEYKERFHHIGGVLHGEETLSISDYAKALQATKICINTQTYPFREQCKGKVREALACGVMLLEEDNVQTRQLIRSGQGVLFFQDKNSLLKHLELLLSDEDKRRKLEYEGQAAWREIGCPNTWVKKIIRLLNLPV